MFVSLNIAWMLLHGWDGRVKGFTENTHTKTCPPNAYTFSPVSHPAQCLGIFGTVSCTQINPTLHLNKARDRTGSFRCVISNTEGQC